MWKKALCWNHSKFRNMNGCIVWNVSVMTMIAFGAIMSTMSASCPRDSHRKYGFSATRTAP